MSESISHIDDSPARIITYAILGLEWTERCGVMWEPDLPPSFTKSERETLIQIDRDYETLGGEATLQNLTETLGNVGNLKLVSTIPRMGTFSLFRVFIQSKNFQSTIFDIVLSFFQMTEYEIPNDTTRSTVKNIIRDLQFLPTIYEHQRFSDVIIESLTSMNEAYKSLLILSLHLIVEASDKLVNVLVDMMRSSPMLTNDAISALESLALSPSDAVRVRDIIKDEILAMASKPDLAVVIRFLTTTTNQENAQATIDSFRENLIVDIPDDNNIFILDLITQALKLNMEFQNAYKSQIFGTEDLSNLDMWVLFTLYTFPGEKENVKKLIEKRLSASLFESAISGHGPALVSIMDTLVDLMSWALENPKPSVMEIGSQMAVSIFKEQVSASIQQDVVAALLLQISIGVEANRENAAKVLKKMSETECEKLKAHKHLIGHLLSSCTSIPEAIFKLCAKTVVNVNFTSAEDVNSGNQLSVFVNKSLTLGKKDFRQRGVILSACYLEKLLQIDINAASDHLNNVMRLLSDDAQSLSLFIENVNEFADIPYQFCDILYNRLNELLKVLFVEKVLNIEDTINTDAGKIAVVVFATSGTPLLLRVKPDADFLDYPVKINKESVSQNFFEACLVCHSFESSCKTPSNRTWELLDMRLKACDDLASAILLTKEEDGPFGTLFPRAHTFLKKLPDDIDRGIALFTHYRTHFVPPSISSCKLLYTISAPVRPSDVKRIEVLSSDLMCLIEEPKKPALFSMKQITEPPVDVAVNAIKVIIPSMLSDSDLKVERAVSIIVDMTRAIISMNVFKNKTTFEAFLKDAEFENRQNMLLYVADLYDRDLPATLQVSILNLLETILKFGPPAKIDPAGIEKKKIFDIANTILRNSNVKIGNKQIKEVLSIMFSNLPEPLQVIRKFAKKILSDSILRENTKVEGWPTISAETFPLYFDQCFIGLVKELEKFNAQRKKDENHITQEAIGLLLKHLKDISKITAQLLRTTVTESLPKPLLKSIAKIGMRWMDQWISILPFLKIAYEVDPSGVSAIVKDVSVGRSNIASKIQYMNVNEPKMRAICNKTMAKTMDWPYKLQEALGSIAADSTRPVIKPMASYSLTGEELSQTSLFSQATD